MLKGSIDIAGMHGKGALCGVSKVDGKTLYLGIAGIAWEICSQCTSTETVLYIQGRLIKSN